MEAQLVSEKEEQGWKFSNCLIKKKKKKRSSSDLVIA